MRIARQMFFINKNNKQTKQKMNISNKEKKKIIKKFIDLKQTDLRFQFLKSMSK